MFILLRRIERWLHQHIFKVGWLMTKNFQTTTILYYTFFLPGVVLQQVIYWLVAGMLNVRGKVEIPFFKREPQEPKTTKQAKGAVPPPEKPPQTTIDISKLKPNFVTLDFSGGRRRNAPKGTYRKAIISTVPLLVALVCIWLIATRIFNIMDVVATMSSGTLPDIAQGISVLTGASNFWVWIYVVFTLANTMFPPVPDELRGWRIIIVSLVAIGLALTVIGIGGEIFEVLQTPVATLINVMQVMLVLIIAIDVLMVLVLGLIEYTIEHVTGHTATFRGDTMEVMTREEADAARERELEKQRRQEERMLHQRNKAADAGPVSVYMLAFPIPGAPNEVGVTPVVEAKPAVKAKPEKPSVMPAANVPAPTREMPGDIAARIHIPERKPLVPRQPDTGDEEVDEAEEPQPVGTVTEPITTPFARPASIPSESISDDADSRTKEVPLTNFVRRPITPVTQEDDTDEDESDAVDTSVQTREIPLAGFGRRPVVPVSETDESDEDEAVDDVQPRQPISLTPASRFTITKPAPDDRDEQDEVEEKPAVAFSRPAFSSPVMQDEPDEIADGADDDEEAAEPVVTTSSRFGVSPFGGLSSKVEDDSAGDDSEDEEEQPVGSVTEPITTPLNVSPFTTASQRETPEDENDDKDDDSEEKPAASISSRFGVSPFRGLSSKPKEAEDEDEKSSVADMTPAKPKGLWSRPAEEDESDEGDEKPAASISSRFGVSPFRGLSSKADITDVVEDEDSEVEKSPFAGLSPAKPKGLLRSKPEDDDNENKPLSNRPLSRTGTTPFANRFQSQTEEDDEEEDDESMLRRGRGDDAVSGLFGGLNTQDEEDEDDDEPSYTRSRFGGLGQTPSRFGSRSVIGRSTADDDDDEYDYDDDEEYIADDDDDVDYVDDDD
jgi:hypothetical protein